MAVSDPLPAPGPPDPAASQRLDSWKEIAAHLKRDESTVRRWEKEGLPVHRHAHKKKASVYAYTSEIDVWWNGGRNRLEPLEQAAASQRRREGWWAIGGLVLLAAVVGLNVGGARDRLLGRPRVGEITSIAVLPLKNLSGDPSQDYFADGTTEALITELGKISALQVVSHQSVSGYRHSDKTVPAIAHELGVDAVLEGTVLHSGDRVRITANLVQAVPERHLWAESYEFDRQDVLAIQSRVAREVAGRIRLKLTPQEQARLTPTRRVDPEAYEAYLLGRAYLFGPTSLSGPRGRAREYFEKAIAKDPGFAPAYASLAELYVGAVGAPARDPRELRLQARQWAEKALALDDTLAEAHGALARASQQEWDWAGAEREYRRAIELNPSYSVARIWYAMYLYAMQRFAEAVAEARRAQQLDPASPLVNTWAGGAYWFGGHHEEAMASWRRALELDADASGASLLIARAYVSQGRYSEAVAQLREAIGLKKTRGALMLGALAHALAREGHRAEALELVDELERNAAEAREYVPLFGLIWAYAGLGEKDHAFAWLERAYDVRMDRMVWLNVDPLLDPLRSDPRFHDLVRRIGLPIRASGGAE